MTTLYRHYDSKGALLYVGIAEDEKKRRKQHERSAPWFELSATTLTENYPTRTEAALNERKAIKREKPIFNKAMNDGTPFLLHEYLTLKSKSYQGDRVRPPMYRVKKTFDAFLATGKDLGNRDIEQLEQDYLMDVAFRYLKFLQAKGFYHLNGVCDFTVAWQVFTLIWQDRYGRRRREGRYIWGHRHSLEKMEEQSQWRGAVDVYSGLKSRGVFV